MRRGDLAVEVKGQTLLLLTERAVFWENGSTLLVADTHFGKAATFRRAGLAVPGGTTRNALARLDTAISRTGAQRVIFLGDYLHAPTGRTQRTIDALEDWRRGWSSVDMTLVRGNHDRSAGDPPPGWQIACVDPPLVWQPFAFAHHPGVVPGLIVIAGHLHPSVRLVATGRQRVRLPCFWFRHEMIVLPAFGDFTGSADIRPEPGDRVFVIADGHVIQINGEERGR